MNPIDIIGCKMGMFYLLPLVLSKVISLYNKNLMQFIAEITI